MLVLEVDRGAADPREDLLPLEGRAALPLSSSSPSLSAPLVVTALLVGKSGSLLRLLKDADDVPPRSLLDIMTFSSVLRFTIFTVLT